MNSKDFHLIDSRDQSLAYRHQQPHPVKSMAGRKSSSTTSTTTTFATSSSPYLMDSPPLVHVTDCFPTNELTSYPILNDLDQRPPMSLSTSPLSILTANNSSTRSTNTQQPSVLVSPLHYINSPPRSRPISPLSVIENTRIGLVSAGAPSFNSRLIMPRISLPYKRPFTATGLKLGELKILIAGDTGLGKSSLIDAVIKTCKEIVHVDCPQEWSPPKDFASRKHDLNAENDFDSKSKRANVMRRDTVQVSTSQSQLNIHNEAGTEVTDESLHSSWDFIGKSTETSLDSKKANTPQPYFKEPYIEPENLAIYEQWASTKPLPSFLVQPNIIATANNSSGSNNNSTNSSSTNSLYSDINYGKPSNSHADSNSQESTEDYEGSPIRTEQSFERNVCFVDTAGYGSFKDPQNCISCTSSYLESQFKQTYSLLNFSNPKAISFILSSSSFNSFNHADVCFYLISDQLTAIDIEYMKQIDQFCPIIPMVSKSDTMKEKQIKNLRHEILQALNKENITPFVFENERNSIATIIPDSERTNNQWLSAKRHKHPNKSDILSSSEDSGDEETDIVMHDDEKGGRSDEFIDSKEETRGQFKRKRTASFINSSQSLLTYPPAISCKVSDDVEMVASILMDPSYEPPLYESDLAVLCTKIFSEEGASWLRYASAKKFIDWTLKRQVDQSLQVQQTINFQDIGQSSSIRAHDYNCSTGNQNNCINNALYQDLNNKSPEPGYYVHLPEDLDLTMCSAHAFEQTAQWIFDLQTKSSTRTNNNSLLSCNHHNCDMFYQCNAGGNVTKGNNHLYYAPERYTPARNVNDQLDSPLPGIMIGPNYHRSSNQRLNDNINSRLSTSHKYSGPKTNPNHGEVFFRNSNHDKVLVSKCMVNVDPLSLNEILLKVAKYALGTISIAGVLGLIIAYWNSPSLFGLSGPSSRSTMPMVPATPDGPERSAFVRGFKLIFNKLKESTVINDPKLDDEEWRKLFAWTMYYT
ncbi:hypothetical protein NADFUDRAFT_53045 [Nadsonia fulvescens var. elongata DSM 6958]|uniref:Septin-type G domain-containing protein n=1 Tax=Nadsonia fulvescens var. elongata DSM 6958 TaxID=857566 RepID=A0A1E3PF84_9ASCO|nr:hypothetical protein NADFUDRAFT_53045 [Nadsonia fulvescens var. elongata DSM 6958]